MDVAGRRGGMGPEDGRAHVLESWRHWGGMGDGRLHAAPQPAAGWSSVAWCWRSCLPACTFRVQPDGPTSADLGRPGRPRAALLLAHCWRNVRRDAGQRTQAYFILPRMQHTHGIVRHPCAFALVLLCTCTLLPAAMVMAQTLGKLLALRGAGGGYDALAPWRSERPACRLRDGPYACTCRVEGAGLVMCRCVLLLLALASRRKVAVCACKCAACILPNA